MTKSKKPAADPLEGMPNWFKERFDLAALAESNRSGILNAEAVLADLRKTLGATCNCGGTGLITGTYNFSDTLDYSDFRSVTHQCGAQPMNWDETGHYATANTAPHHTTIEATDYLREFPREVYHYIGNPACAERWAAYLNSPTRAELVALINNLRLEAERLEAAVRQIDRDHTPARGSVVIVVKGRKVPLATVGRVFWCGDNGYGTSVGIIALDGAKYFTAIGNVVVADPSPERNEKLAEVAEADRAAYKARKK